MKRLLIALACLSFTPVLVSAEELCPGCGGGGRIGCTACAEPFGIVWVGKCKGCQGPWAQNRGGRCNRCNGSGICQACMGKGQPCGVCKGSGRVPNGTNARIREGKEKEAREKLAAALKPLDFTVGMWKGQGNQGDQKLSIEYSWERLYGDCYRALIERDTVGGETTEAAAILTYSPSQDAYLYYVFTSREGGGSLLTGYTGADGKSIVFSAPATEGRELRVTYGLDPDAARSSTLVEVGAAGDWQTLSKSKSERTGDGALKLSKAEPAGHLKDLSGILGSWKAVTKAQGKELTATIVWKSVLGGNWFFMSEDGNEDDAVAMLSWAPDTKQYLWVTFDSRGRINVLNGKSGGDGKLEFYPSGNDQVRSTWSLSEDENTIRMVVETKGERGWTVVAETEAERK